MVGNIEDQSFESWLVKYLSNENEENKKIKGEETNKLLKNEMAIKFLITWSLFESRCFNGEFFPKDIPCFLTKIKSYQKECIDHLSLEITHFFQRYNGKENRHFNNLFYHNRDECYKKKLKVYLQED